MKATHVLLTASAILNLGAGVSTSLAEDAKFNLVLDEDFDAPELNTAIWNIETMKRGDAKNSPQSVDIIDGILTLTTFTNESGQMYSGFVTTRKRLLVSQGKIEARVRFSPQPGTQCAIWANSAGMGNATANDPDSVNRDGVEIDIMESHGKMAGGYQYATHWGGYEKAQRSHGLKFPAKVGDTWHVYGCEWDSTGYRFLFDGKVVATENQCPPTSAPLYLIISMEAKRTNGWAGEIPKEGYGSKETSKNKLEVDWVKVWERAK